MWVEEYSPKAPAGPLRQYMVGAPMEWIAIDVTGRLPRATSGNTSIVVIADYFTKWIEAFSIPDQTAESDGSPGFGRAGCYTIWCTVKYPYGPGAGV